MESQRVIYFKFKVTFILSFFSTGVNKILFSKNTYRHLKSVRTDFCFVHSNNLAASTSVKQCILKNIFSEEES
eukprot:UN22743